MSNKVLVYSDIERFDAPGLHDVHIDTAMK